MAAIDASRHAIAKLCQRLEAQELNDVEVSCKDVNNIPYPDLYFDAVVDIVCLAHNDNCRDLIREISRVMKPGARMLSFIPKQNCWQQPYEGKGTVTFMGEPEVREVFKGYFDIKLGYTEHSDGDKNQVLRHWVVDARRV